MTAIRIILLFLRSLFKGADEGYLNIWTLPGKQSHFFELTDLSPAADKVLELSKKHDVYFSVGLQESIPVSGRGTGDDIIVIPCVWMDIDIKGPNHKSKKLPLSKKEALDFLNSLPLKPSIVIFTGGGLHAYWLFKKVWKFNSSTDRLECKEVVSGFQQMIIATGNQHGWELDNTADLARVLRLPETKNRKRETPQSVKILANNKVRYTIEEIKKYCVITNDSPVKRPGPTKITTTGIIPEGERNNVLMSLMGKLIRQNLSIEAICSALIIENQQRCRPPLEDSQMDAMLKFVQIYAANQADKQSKPKKPSKDLQIEVVREVINKYGVENIVTTKEGTFIWGNNGVWEEVLDRRLKQDIHQVTQDCQLTKSATDSCVDMLKTETFNTNVEFNKVLNFINCVNGELHWNGVSFELKPHNRDNLSTIQLPVECDATAKAPRFKKFIREIFAGDADRKEKIRVISEMMGYSLTSGTSFERFIILYGDGANGKSVLMATVKALIGAKNSAAVQPCQFDKNFSRAHLDKKLINLVTEIPDNRRIAESQLKAIVSGETTTVEHKFKNPFETSLFSTCWFGSNHLPDIKDDSQGVYRRAIIVLFNNTFPETEQDRTLKIKLQQELPGILNFALKGLARILTENDFTPVSSGELLKNQWRKQNDPFTDFVNQRCKFGVEFRVSSHDLFEAYQIWAKETGNIRSISHKFFTREMIRRYQLKISRSNDTRWIAGVKLMS